MMSGGVPVLQHPVKQCPNDDDDDDDDDGVKQCPNDDDDDDGGGGGGDVRWCPSTPASC